MSEILPTPDAAHAPGVSRRTVLKTAAWSAPVLAVAMAVPAAAASDPPIGVDPSLITLDVYKEGTLHGFRISSTAMETLMVLVTFTASADGGLNLISATTTPFAGYAQTTGGGATAESPTETYRDLWNNDFAAVDGRVTRSGQMTFTLPPDSFFQFWQAGLSLLGAPRITGIVTSIAPEDGSLTPVADGDSAEFELP